MAYAFNRVKAVLEGGEQKQDIFGDPNATQAGQPNVQRQAEAKTTTEGMAPGAAGGSPATAAKPEEQAPSGATAATQQSVFTRQTDRQKAPKVAGQLYGQLDEAQKGLKNEADQWVQSATSQSYGVGNDALEKAIGGDQAAATQYRDLKSKNAETVKVDKGFDPTTDYDIEGVAEFQTDEGVKRALARESGPQYTAGEGAYDLMLLNRNADFARIRNELAQNQNELGTLATNLRDTKTKEANETRARKLTEAQTAADSYLGGKGDELSSAQAAEAAAINAQLADLRGAGGQEKLKALSGSSADRMRGYFQGVDPRILKSANFDEINAGDFFNVRGDVGADDMYDDAEAARFNSIMGLLGRGGQAKVGAGAGELYSFRDKDYESALHNRAITQRAGADDKLKSEIDALINPARAEAEAINARRGSALNGMGDQMSRDKAAAEAEVAREFGGNLWGQSLNNDSSYYNMGGTVGDYRSLLNDQARARLASLTGDLGVDNVYDDVGYTGAGSDTSFQADRYKEALRNMIRQRASQASREPGPVGPANQIGAAGQGAVQQHTGSGDKTKDPTGTGPGNRYDPNSPSNPFTPTNAAKNPVAPIAAVAGGIQQGGQDIKKDLGKANPVKKWRK